MNFPKRALDSVPIDNKTVLLRTDFNVPIDSNDKIQDDFLIESSLETIKELLNRHCKVVIISHTTHFDGKRKRNYSLEIVAARLATKLGRPVHFVDDCVGEKARMAVKTANQNDITIFENLRFHKGELTNSREFAKQLAAASQADYFVQDAFGLLHEKLASTCAITELIPSVAGRLVEKEYNMIKSIMAAPGQPVLAILGGAKVSAKVHLLESMINISDHLVVGGGLGNTFLAYKGINIGKSHHEMGQDEVLSRIYRAADRKVGLAHVDELIKLPIDAAVDSGQQGMRARQEKNIWQIDNHERILDIGIDTLDEIISLIKTAKTIIWNGPFGMVERSQFRHGSEKILEALAEKNTDSTILICGGDTVGFVRNWCRDNKKTINAKIFSGGGAALEVIANQNLPGLDSLLDGNRELSYTKKEET